jgi:signal transduction histidine kinase
LSTPLRVLFVEDSEDDMRLLVRQLRQGGYSPSVERVETADGLRSALHRGGWDVIISDYSMPRFSGLEALAVTLQLASDVPFLMMSGTVGEEVAVESIQSGAADYLMKQNLIRFVPAVARAVRDAAERRAMLRAEAVLREQRSLLGMIYDNTSDAVILFTWEPHEAAWILRSINRATLHLTHALGIEAGEDALLGKPLEQVVRNVLTTPADEGESVIDDFYRAAESGRPRTRETRLVSTQSALLIDLTLIPFFGPDGSTRHVLTVARDITARKRAEDARREFEARLAQSRKMEALGQLAGGVAHDFNNILAGILGFADVIRRGATDDATATFSAEIIQAATRARDLIRQILMFSRRQPAERKPVRLAPIAREAVQLIQQAAPPGVQVVSRLAVDSPYIMGDATQLHQVVMNLGTNAVQAMGDAGGRLEIVVESVEVSSDFALRHAPLRAGASVRLAISDSGPGMPQAVLDRLFEPFFTTKAPGVGTGLGLSVVHGVVQNHEGAIVVESRPGNGTTFEVFLPAVKSPSWSGELPVSQTAASPISRRILFCDDESSITRLADVMLRALGHTASTFNRGAEAIAAIRANRDGFDLIITDLTMPGMTGVEFARGIRGIRADIPIILSSGFADEVPEETLKELGIVEVLPKPFQLQALAAAISRAMAEPGSSA